MKSEIYLIRESLCEIGIGKKSWWEGQSYYEETKDIVRICQNGSFGLEIDGKEILPAIYSSIICFDSNYDDKESWLLVEQNNKYGLFKCTENGSVFCLEVIYDEISKYPYCNNTATLRLGGMQGLYDLDRGVVVPCLYDEIIKPTSWGFHVKLKGLNGIHDNIPCIYDDFEIKDYSYAIVIKNGGRGICKRGKEIIPPIYDLVEYCYFDMYKTFLNGKVGVYENDCLICNPLYDDFFIDYRGNILRKNELYGIITDNKKIIEPQYEDIKKLSSTFYAYLQMGRWGIVDENNRIILSPQYQDIYTVDMADDEGKPLFRVKIGLYWGIVNLNGLFVIPTKYDYITSDKGIIYVRKGRNSYRLDNNSEKFVKKIGADYSCGYIDDSLLFKYDCNLMNLFDTDEQDAPTSKKDVEITTDELPF